MKEDDSMTDNEILSNLCVYDPRNPDYYYNEDAGIGLKEPPKDCKCDNCFYGRTRLARELLRRMRKFAV